jgi:hypothetical protein
MGAMPKRSSAWVSYRGQRVGRREGSAFVRRVGPGAQLRRPPSWALWAGLVDQLERDGFETVSIEEGETGPVWVAPLTEFRQHGIPIDRGQGPQLALTLDRWARMEVRMATAADLDAFRAELDREAERILAQLDLGLGGAL